MGQSTFITASSNNRHKKPQTLHMQVDSILFVIVAALMIVGLLFVFSASWQVSMWQKDTPGPGYILIRQIIFAAAGIAVAFIVSRVDYHFFPRLAVLIGVVTLVLLVIVFLIIKITGSETRSILGGSVQPSELAKLATIIYLSVWLDAKRDQLKHMNFGLIPLGAILGLVAFLIAIEPDYSAAVTIIILGLLMFFLAEGDWRQVMLVMLVAFVVIFALLEITQKSSDRIAQYLAGFRSPDNASPHMKRVFEAIVNGGVFGMGLGNGVTKHTGLPVAWTDSIYAVIIEESGLIGATALILLYCALIWRGLKIASLAPDTLGKLLASGVTAWIGVEAMMNMGVIVNLIPFTGNALPFVSYGGSSLITNFAAIGILMGVSRRSNKPKTPTSEGRSFGASVDLRWRDRRRRVPRTRGSRSLDE